MRHAHADEARLSKIQEYVMNQEFSNAPTKKYLQSLNACAEARTWVGDKSLAQAWNECTRLDWLRRLVDAVAMAEYERVTASALAEYDRVVAPAEAEYDRVTAPARGL